MVMTERKMVEKYRQLCRYLETLSLSRSFGMCLTSNDGVSRSNSSNLNIESSIPNYLHESLNCEIVLGTGEDTK